MERGLGVSYGFVLRRLAVTGRGRPEAALSFHRGLNVIVGPSDTGKTYIAQCLDFIMGSQTPPKSIPQAQGYTSLEVELESEDGSYSCRLQRGLTGGDIQLSSDGKNTILAAKHQAEKTDTVSYFLLGLSGLAGKKVRTNQQGKTRSLSFRDIAHLVIVDEESIIATQSPVVTGQYTTATTEARVFRLLLTGSDDSSIVAKPDLQAQKVRQEGMADLLAEMIRQAQNQLVEARVEATAAEIRDQLMHVDAAVAMAGNVLASAQTSAAGLEERRRNAWSRLREIESNENVLVELETRFALLRSQYQSDLRRLEAIGQAGKRLGQMNEERCPVCGSLFEHHDRTHQREGFDPADVAAASRAEADKTGRLLRDLGTTLTDTAIRVAELGRERETRRVELEAAATELRTAFQPRIQQAVQQLREAQAQREAAKHSLDLLERVAELESRLADAMTPPQKQTRVVFTQTRASTGEAEPFCKEVEALLHTWHFPNLDRVTFSDADQDIVISGRARASHGKGVRAITHAAFNIGLLSLCKRAARPFPGLVIIDSPLVVYREPDATEGEFPLDVKDAFYRSLANDFTGVQVVILENDAPPSDVDGVANVVAFSGNESGRRGFFG